MHFTDNSKKERVKTNLSPMDKIKKFIKSHPIIVVCLVLLVVAAIASSSTEQNRHYDINFNDEYNIACNVADAATGGSLSCSDNQIEGKFSQYDDVEPRVEGYKTKTSGDKLTIELPKVNIKDDLWQKDDFNIDNIANEVDNSTIKIKLYDKKAGKTVLEKSVKVDWELSNDDKQKILNKHNEWVAQKQAKAEAERQKAEQEAARQREEAAARQREEAARQRASQQAAQAAQATAATTRTNTGGGRANANTNTYVPPTQSNVYYRNCSEVRAAGKAPLYRGQPGYSTKLDRDKDGIACE